MSVTNLGLRSEDCPGSQAGGVPVLPLVGVHVHVLGERDPGVAETLGQHLDRTPATSAELA
jgi:hypothetical protein